MVKNTHEKDELKNCINKYLRKNRQVCVADTNSKKLEYEMCRLFTQLSRLEYRDCPDGYIKLKNKIIIVEHFEIDCSLRNRKGSQARKEEFRIDKQFENINPYQCTNIAITRTEKMSIKTTAENLMNNFIDSYNQHFQMIGQYKNNLIDEKIANERTKFEVCFFIEDISPLGSLHFYNSKLCGLWAIDIKECIDFIKVKPIDYMFLFNNDHVYFARKKDLRKLRQNSLSCKDIFMPDMEPMVMQTTMYIPKENK